MGGLGVGFWNDEPDHHFWCGEKEKADGAHEDESINPGGAQGFEGHLGIAGSKVLSDEGGGGSADGEAGEEGEGLDANGDDVSAEGAIKPKAGDESKHVEMDGPHAEHFDSLGKADTADAGHHFGLRSPACAAQGEGDFVSFGGGFPAHKDENDDRAEEPAEETAPGEAGDAQAAEGRFEEDESGAQDHVTNIDEEHDEEWGTGVANGAQGIGAGVENSEERAGPGEDGEVVEGVSGGGV